MKKIISVILSVIILVGGFMLPVSANEYSLKTDEIHIRDPFVLTYEGKYYMYGTGVVGSGYGCYVSEDLENWTTGIQVFAPYDGFDGTMQYWAPECHYYNGSFYLFATYYSGVTEKRGVGIFKSDSPTGPFTQLGDGHITPHYRDCIDGTLYVDEDGQPWMIYVNEWTSNEDGIGTMAAAKLNDELSGFISDPIELFGAKDPLWTDSKVTDGPFLYKTSNGKLIMLWSNTCKKGYAVGIAWSSNGRIDGKWYQQPITLYENNLFNDYDGGHGMLFTDFDGQMRMTIHSPNHSTDGVFEKAKFIPMKDIGDTVVCEGNYNFGQKLVHNMMTAALRIYYFFANLFIR